MRIYLTEFARDRKEIADKLEEHTADLMDHLIKIYLYPDHESVNHWKTEAYEFIHRVPLMKQNHKYPSSKFIYNNTWVVWGDTIDSHIKVIQKDYDYSPFSKYNNIIEQYCREYFKWLSEILSQDGAISRDECYTKINELLQNYR